MRLTVPAAPIVLLASLTLLNLWLAAPALAETNPLCPGEMAQPHKVGNFDFETNSRLEEHASVSQYKFEIISCVGNHDQVYPLRAELAGGAPHQLGTRRKQNRVCAHSPGQQ
jgi:hypothetical protein